VKWTNHVGLTGAVAYAITGDIWRASIAATGAVVPDWIEGGKYDRKIHRTVSHWMLMYAIVLVVSTGYLIARGHNGMNVYLLFLGDVPLDTALIIAVFVQYVSIGAIMHICEDALCGKVPLLSPVKRDFGASLFRVGSATEYIITVAVMAIVAAFYLLKENYS